MLAKLIGMLSINVLRFCVISFRMWFITYRNREYIALHLSERSRFDLLHHLVTMGTYHVCKFKNEGVSRR